MSDKPPSDAFMRALLGDVFMVQPDGIYADSGNGPERISKSLDRVSECQYCKGLGKVQYYHGDLDTCPTCHGAGYVAEVNP